MDKDLWKGTQPAASKTHATELAWLECLVMGQDQGGQRAGGRWWEKGWFGSHSFLTTQVPVTRPFPQQMHRPLRLVHSLATGKRSTTNRLKEANGAAALVKLGVGSAVWFARPVTWSDL